MSLGKPIHKTHLDNPFTDDLDAKKVKILLDWIDKFRKKYPIVAQLSANANANKNANADANANANANANAKANSNANANVNSNANTNVPKWMQDIANTKPSEDEDGTSSSSGGDGGGIDFGSAKGEKPKSE